MKQEQRRETVRRAWARGVAGSLGLLVALHALAGCAASVEQSDPTVSKDTTGTSDTRGTTDSTGTTVHEDSVVSTVVQGVTTTLGAATQDIGLCTPLTCCFPTGSQWGTDSFETSLRALGCSTPRAYAESYEASQWWMFSQCPASPALTALVAQDSNVSPYYASLAINECLFLDAAGKLQLNDVFVQFDPTCSSCRVAAK